MGSNLVIPLELFWRRKNTEYKIYIQLVSYQRYHTNFLKDKSLHLYAQSELVGSSRLGVQLAGGLSSEPLLQGFALGMTSWRAQGVFFEMLLPKQLGQDSEYIVMRRLLNQRKILIGPAISCMHMIKHCSLKWQCESLHENLAGYFKHRMPLRVTKSPQAACWLMPTSYHASLYLSLPRPCVCSHWVFAHFWAVIEDKGQVLSAEPRLGRTAAWQLLRAPSWDQGSCPKPQGQLYLAWLFLRNRLTGGMESICPYHWLHTAGPAWIMHLIPAKPCWRGGACSGSWVPSCLSSCLFLPLYFLSIL